MIILWQLWQLSSSIVDEANPSLHDLHEAITVTGLVPWLVAHDLLHEGLHIVQLPVAALVLHLVSLKLVVLQERLQEFTRVDPVLK